MAGIIFSGMISAEYAQLGLFDAEDPNAYPEWETGEENVVFGPRGIAVSAAPSEDVWVVVHTRGPVHETILAASGDIEVGDEGLIVGNQVAGTFSHLTSPAGRRSVEYTQTAAMALR